MFISMIYAVLDPKKGEITFARAGHDPLMVFRKATELVETFKPKGLALGIDGGSVFERATQDATVVLAPGDCVLIFTDGIKEAVNDLDEEFGMRRLSQAFSRSAVLGAEAVVQSVLEAVSDFTGDGPQMDDITIVAIEKR